MENHTREQLLKLLENNSRLTNAELAIMLDVTQEQIHDEIASLEKKHIICGYHTLINWDKVNDNDVTALVELHVTPQGGNGYRAAGRPDQTVSAGTFSLSDVRSLRFPCYDKRKNPEGDFPVCFR